MDSTRLGLVELCGGITSTAEDLWWTYPDSDLGNLIDEQYRAKPNERYIKLAIWLVLPLPDGTDGWECKIDDWVNRKVNKWIFLVRVGRLFWNWYVRRTAVVEWSEICWLYDIYSNFHFGIIPLNFAHCNTYFPEYILALLLNPRIFLSNRCIERSTDAKLRTSNIQLSKLILKYMSSINT